MENQNSTTSVTIRGQIQSRPAKSLFWLLGYLFPTGGDIEILEVGLTQKSVSRGEDLSKLRVWPIL